MNVQRLHETRAAITKSDLSHVLGYISEWRTALDSWEKLSTPVKEMLTAALLCYAEQRNTLGGRMPRPASNMRRLRAENRWSVDDAVKELVKVAKGRPDLASIAPRITAAGHIKLEEDGPARDKINPAIVQVYEHMVRHGWEYLVSPVETVKR